MKLLILIALTSLMALPLASCSSADTCTKNGNFRIDFYSSGGFTGMQQGVTISCEGWAKFWKAMPNSARVTTDSVNLSSGQLQKFADFINNPEVFSYKNKFAGNYTAHLVVMKDIQMNSISFNESDPPQGMPAVITDLIAEIKNINKK